MKHLILLMTGLAGFLVAVPTASAKDGKASHKGHRKQQLRAKYDTDKDGAFSKEEVAAMPAKLSKRLVKKGDTDHDGAISASEFKAVRLAKKHHKHHKGHAGKK